MIKSQFSIIGSANNVNDQGFSGGGPRWRRNNGLNATKMLGANFATETENWNWEVVCVTTIVMQM